jgi:hypothetical protein
MRHADPRSALLDGSADRRPVEQAIVPETIPPPFVRRAERVERLAYTRTEAALALGVSPAVFARRVLPLIETIAMPWGRELVPVDELERLVAECRRPARGRVRAKAAGRRPMLPDDVVRRIVAERAAAKSLAQIARDLNADGVPTAHDGAQWWPSSVRVVLNGQTAARLAAATLPS